MNNYKNEIKKSKNNSGLLLIAIGLIVVVLLATVFAISRQISGLNDKIIGITDSQQMMVMAIENQKSKLKPALNIDQNALAFPEIRIQIPYDNRSNTLIYNNKFLKGEDSQKYEEGLSISSILVGEDPYMAQMSCQDLVRLSFVSDIPNSPWEGYSGNVKLEDGRTLYIFKSIAYENNEASTAYCPYSSWQSITPDEVAELFKQAKSY